MAINTDDPRSTVYVQSDPRDAEIARLRAELAEARASLAFERVTIAEMKLEAHQLRTNLHLARIELAEARAERDAAIRERDAAYVAENVACKDAGTFAIENDKLRARLAEVEQERDEARRERDARPAISREDAAWLLSQGGAEVLADDPPELHRMQAALRAHAASATPEPPQVDAGRCPACKGSGRGTWNGDYAGFGRCGACNGAGRKGER